jgi:hypothetical protein
VTRTVPALLVLALALAPSAGSAQGRLTLRWTAPPACPDAATVQREVERLLGGALPDGPPVVAEADTSPDGEGYRLALETQMAGARGERVLEGPRCAELAAATALILALMIDPEAVARAESSPPDSPAPSLATALASPRMESMAESSPLRTQQTMSELAARDGAGSIDAGSIGAGSIDAGSIDAAPTAESTGAAPDPLEPPVSNDTLGGFVGVVGLLDVGTLPAPTAGVALEAGFGIPLVDGRLRATYLVPQPGDSAVVPGVGADLMAASLEARGCVRPIEDARAIGACGGLAAGAVFGTGRGVADPQSGVGFWLAASIGLALAWAPVDWLDLELDADLVIPLYDSDFVVDLAGRDVDVFVPSDVAGRFGLAAHVRFR